MNLADAAEKALPSIRKSASAVDQVAYSRDLWPRHHIAVRDGVLHFGFPTDAGGGLFGIGRGVGLEEDDGLFPKRIESLGFAMDRPVEQ